MYERKALEIVNPMVLNLFRLSNDFGSNLLVVLLIVFVHKNPVVRLVEFVSEHSRLLLIFGTKKSGSRSKTLKFKFRDMPG